MAEHPRSLGPALRPLESLLGDPAVTTVHINGADDVWVRRSDRVERADVEMSAGKVRVLADAIARAVDADDDTVRFGRRFAEGMRVMVVRPPAAPKGPIITLSRPPAGPATVDDLVSWGGLSGDALARIGEALDEGVGVLVAGPVTASRKALLMALASGIRDSERVVLIDDGSVHPPELSHLIRLQVNGDRGALVTAAAALDGDRIVLDEVGPDELLTILLDAGDAYSGVMFAAPGATVEAAVDRLLCIARGAASTGDPAPLLPVCLGLVVVASGAGGAEPRVAEIGEIEADPATGAPAVRLLFRRSGPGGDLVPTDFRAQRSSTSRVPAMDMDGPEDLPRGFRTTVAPLDEEEEPSSPGSFDDPMSDRAQAEAELPPPPAFEEQPDTPQPALAPPPPEVPASPHAPRSEPEMPSFDDRTNIIRMIPKELLDIEE